MNPPAWSDFKNEFEVRWFQGKDGDVPNGRSFLKIEDAIELVNRLRADPQFKRVTVHQTQRRERRVLISRILNFGIKNYENTANDKSDGPLLGTTGH